MSDDLVERVARAMWMADPDPYDPADRRPFEDADWEAQRNYRAEARAAIAVCMEEAASYCEMKAKHYWGDGCDCCDAALQQTAAAIRALVKEVSDE